MRFLAQLFIFTGIAFVFNVRCMSPLAFAEVDVVSSRQLIEESKNHDGKEIIYQGEAIGHIMRRGKQYVWVNVSDGNNAIGIWSPWGLVKKVSVLGSYKYKGDVLEIKGQFSQTCSQHGGDLDIHARKIKILENGYEVKHPINPKKVKLAILLGILALILGIINICKNKLGIKRG